MKSCKVWEAHEIKSMGFNKKKCLISAKITKTEQSNASFNLICFIFFMRLGGFPMLSKESQDWHTAHIQFKHIQNSRDICGMFVNSTFVTAASSRLVVSQISGAKIGAGASLGRAMWLYFRELNDWIKGRTSCLPVHCLNLDFFSADDPSSFSLI